jgi:hypothetical protein
LFYDSQGELKQAMSFSCMEEELFLGLVHLTDVLDT